MVSLFTGMFPLGRDHLLPDKIQNQIWCPRDGWSLPIIQKCHMFVKWNAKTNLFTKYILYHLPRSFLHKMEWKLLNVMDSGFPDQRHSATFLALNKITVDCIWFYQKINSTRTQSFSFEYYNYMPWNFRFGLNAADFDKPIADTQTNFQNAVFIKGGTARDV